MLYQQWYEFGASFLSLAWTLEVFPFILLLAFWGSKRWHYYCFPSEVICSVLMNLLVYVYFWQLLLSNISFPPALTFEGRCTSGVLFDLKFSLHLVYLFDLRFSLLNQSSRLLNFDLFPFHSILWYWKLNHSKHMTNQLGVTHEMTLDILYCYLKWPDIFIAFFRIHVCNLELANCFFFLSVSCY